MMIKIPTNPLIIKILLFLTWFFYDKHAVLVCKGYGDDWDYYTGLYWQEDKDLGFYDYDDFQLWLNN